MVRNILAGQATQNHINFRENVAARAHADATVPMLLPMPESPNAFESA
jgi:hypothetical protein